MLGYGSCTRAMSKKYRDIKLTFTVVPLPRTTRISISGLHLVKGSGNVPQGGITIHAGSVGTLMLAQPTIC